MKIDPRDCGIATRAVHVGHDPSDRPEDRTGAVTVPIYQTSTYRQEVLQDEPEYEYGRVQNPTRDALERNVAALEDGAGGYAFASGMAAITNLMTVLDPGDEVVVSRDVYGGTRRFFEQVLRRYGLRFHWLDTSRPAEVASCVRRSGKVRMIYVETPSNPMMEISDLAALAEIAHSNDALLAVDNTFLSPVLQKPIALGADVVIHSTTKFIGGHSDSLGGVLITGKDTPSAITNGHLPGVQEGDLGAHFAYMQKCSGAILSPFEAFLILRGIRTLAVRMAKHEENGRKLASFLDQARGRSGIVGQILYPGLESHPGHAVQRRQAGGFGAMISFDLGTAEAAKTFLESLEVFTLAESLGGVESLACLPAKMTHASVTPEVRQSLGITDSLVRLSVGIETYADLERDIDQALERAAATHDAHITVGDHVAC